MAASIKDTFNYLERTFERFGLRESDRTTPKKSCRFFVNGRCADPERNTCEKCDIYSPSRHAMEYAVVHYANYLNVELKKARKTISQYENKGMEKEIWHDF